MELNTASTSDTGVTLIAGRGPTEPNAHSYKRGANMWVELTDASEPDPQQCKRPRYLNLDDMGIDKRRLSREPELFAVDAPS